MDDVLGIFGTILFVAFIVGSMWVGCDNGKAAAERDFTTSEAYREWQAAQASAENRIDSAKSEAASRIEEVKRKVRAADAENAALSAEVELRESLALPTDNETDEKFDASEKMAINAEFERWARSERHERWTEAERRSMIAERNRAAARERLKVVEKSFWSKFGVSKPDDDQYRAFIAKADEAEKERGKIIEELQDMFFKAETETALAKIKRMMNGPHGDDGMESRLKILEKNAERMRKDAEERHRKQ